MPIIGAYKNSYSVLKRKQDQDEKIRNDTEGILSPIDYKAFWIKVMEGGLIEFGREDDSTPILSYEDPDPVPVRFFSFTAWFDTPVKYLYDCRFDQNEADSEQPYQPLDLRNVSTPVPSSTPVPDNKLFCTPHPPCPSLPDKHIYHSTAQSTLPRFINPYPGNYPYGNPYPYYPAPPGHPHYPPHPHGSYPGYPPYYPLSYPASYPSSYPAPYPPYIQSVPSVDAPNSGNGVASFPSAPPAIGSHYPDDNIHWVPSNKTSFHSLTSSALFAGYEGWDGSPLWVIRARYAGDLVPGKLAAKHRSAFISFDKRDIRVDCFEVLCISPALVRWENASMGEVPPNALVGGETETGEKLYIGRARHELSLTPGKIHPSHRCLYMPFGGREVRHMRYEVLVKI